MSEAIDDSAVFSLADIADLDISEVAEIRMETLPQGLYTWEVKEAELDEKDNKDGDNRIRVNFKFEVLECTSCLQRGVDKDTLVGKTHTERQIIVPDQGQQKLLEGIGRARAFIWDMGCENKGVLRQIVEATVGHRFSAPLTHRPNPNDKNNPFAQLKLTKRPAA